MKDKIVEKLSQKHPNIARILGDRGKMALIKLCVSLFITFLFVVYNSVLAVVYVTQWNIILGGYYFLLLVSKIGLLFGFGKSKKQDNAEFHGALTYLLSGIVLFVLHTPLVLLVILTKEQSFHYAGVLVYIYALYAFYKIISAIVNCVKTAKNKSGLALQAMRNINLSEAMVSILALQTALISAADAGNFGANANIITGGVICGIVMLGSVFMIIRASVRLVKIRRKSNGREKLDE